MTTASSAPGSTSTWMARAGIAVFAAVLVLLAFVLPPLLDTSNAGSGPGGHTPPTSAPSGPPGTADTTPSTAAPGAGGHTPPPGGHGPPPTDGG